MLLYARLISFLATERRDRVLGIMAGDFTETNPFDAALAEMMREAGGK